MNKFLTTIGSFFFTAFLISLPVLFTLSIALNWVVDLSVLLGIACGVEFIVIWCHTYDLGRSAFKYG